MIAHEINMNKDTVYQILTEELGMRKICAKQMLKNFSVEQIGELLDHSTSEPIFVHRVVPGDEPWVFEYDPVTKGQSTVTEQ